MSTLKDLFARWLAHQYTWCLYRFKVEEKARRTFEYLLYHFVAINLAAVLLLPTIILAVRLQIRNAWVVTAIGLPIFVLAFKLTVGVYESRKREIWRDGRVLLKRSAGIPGAAVIATFLPAGLLLLMVAILVLAG